MNKSRLKFKYLKNSPLKVDILNDAFSTEFRITPRENILTPLPDFQAHCRQFTTGCIYNNRGEKNHLSERIGAYGGDHVSSINPLLSLAPRKKDLTIIKNTYFLGTWMAHYGHFITETLSRLWQQKDMSQHDSFTAFPFVFRNGAINISTYQAYFLHLLDFPIKNIHFLTKPTHFKNITIPEQGWVINHTVNINIKPLYQRIRDSHFSTKGKFDKIFLSRKEDSYNRVKNVTEVEHLFISMGFVIIYPAQISIQDQLSIYANCHIMASFSGSSLHNCLFTRDDTLIVEVADSRSHYRMLPMQESALELSGNEYAFIPYIENSDGELDIEALSAQLKKTARL